MKTTLSIVLVLVLCRLAKAQETHFGLKAGVNVSSLDVKNGVDFDSKAGFHIGGLAHVHLSPHFAAQPEVIYSEQGGTDGGDKWKLNYINVPVLLQYMAGDGFRVQTGPQLGIAVSSRIKSGNIEENINNSINTIDFSWGFGASYLSTTGLGVDARYNLGITNVNDANFPEVRNRVFQAGLFYQFRHNAGRRH